ncbi:transcription initiation factor TFIID subunit 3 isoform X1 [Eleutherodactylus coqui]|uniref:transcription initiation factor TFIID subunit 3 isoform X1 n=1 Tax=Eleutherodactylus coqui TaxID=57060 RepID=UPI0034622A3F
MCESYSRSLLRVSVAQICQALGWDSVQVTACDLLTDVLHRYLQQLCRGARRYSELYGRSDPLLDDVGQAFKLMGVNLHELEDYIHNIEPVTFPNQIPSFPVSKNNVLQFPPPGSKDLEDRKEYIPDYLPLIVSSQEEEEEEQVPTDVGTSAEAMQVSLEEGEMEDDETINDENYLSKRPLDSPEVLEMPFAKRQRLANSKGDILDGALEPREPLSSINAQKVSPMLSPSHIQDNSDSTISSSEPIMLSPVKPQTPSSKPLESKAFTSKTKSKSSPGQKTKSPKSTPLTAVLGSPMRSPKSSLKDKKSPGRAKSPKSPKSPKASAPSTQPTVKSETPSRTPLAALSEKIGRENIQVKQNQASQDSEKLNTENPCKKQSVADNTIEDSIDAVIARACAEQEPDPFEFSSGSESEGDVFTSPKRLTIAEPATPKVTAANSLIKSCSTPLPASGGTSSSDISWTMDDSINEVIRKVNQETPPNPAVSQPCFSSPSASPPTPEPLVKTFEEKSKLSSPVELKKKAKKEPKTKMKKKDKEKQKDKDKTKEKNKDKNKEKDKDGVKDSKLQWKDTIKDDDGEIHRLKSKDLNDSEPKPKQKENSGKKEKEKHKDKKKDKEKSKKDKEKKEKGKEKNKEEKLKSSQSAPVVLPPKDMSLPIINTPNSVRLPSLMPSMSPLVPEKVTEDREKTKEKDKKKEKKEKKKKKDKEKVKEKEKEKKEKDKKDKDKEKHKHEKQAKVELSLPAPSPVIPRLTLRVGAGQDTIVISKVVSAPDAKAAPPPSLPKSPPPAPSPAPAPVIVVPPPVQAPPAPAATSPAPNPAPPAPASNTGNSKTPYRSVVTETVSTYVIRDEWGNQIWICPGCNKLDDGSPMVGCDGCDEWYHWPCVGLTAEPEADKWYCTKCDGKKKDKKHKKRKHKAH